ncbi:hypothetical protein LJB99_06050, partial [Deltaproteobacteria bacterium OttesenSCG-928-K17]|nr:hypothetical protein [Deltaproteobacteria bacterium OttesenSCG-928-K17]
MDIGILCSGEGPELAFILAAAKSGRLPADIKIIITDRDSSALALAREAGFYGCFVPRAIFHANRDGFERRLVELLREAGAEAVVLAGFLREPGPVLEEAFPGKIFGRDIPPEALAAHLEKQLRSAGLSL